jgi:hypothetical protein
MCWEYYKMVVESRVVALSFSSFELEMQQPARQQNAFFLAGILCMVLVQWLGLFGSMYSFHFGVWRIDSWNVYLWDVIISFYYSILAKGAGNLVGRDAFAQADTRVIAILIHVVLILGGATLCILLVAGFIANEFL